MTSPHLVTKLIGAPYKHGGKTLKGFDCWGLVWYFFNELGVDTPMPTDYETRTSNKTKHETAQSVLSEKLEPTDNLEEPCVIVFSKNGLTIHAGVWIPKVNKVMHCIERMGVVLEHLQTAEMTRGVKGRFYQWV